MSGETGLEGQSTERGKTSTYIISLNVSYKIAVNVVMMIEWCWTLVFDID